jgi:hypothetical protein
MTRVRQNKMSPPEEMMHEVGAFDPLDAKKILAALEAAGTRFEVESDHSELTRPGRTFQLAVGMSPPGSKLRIFVPESSLSEVQTLVAELFPL